MDTLRALRAVSELGESQWGLVTSAQARALGVSHMNLSRMAAAGDLERVAHGVYRVASVPSDQHEALRAAWLATDPGKLAHERLSASRTSTVVSGESAAVLHEIGDFRAAKSEFTVAARKQTQRPDVRYRTLELPDVDVTIRGGLPVTTRERTIADLVQSDQDLSLVGDALADALRQSRLDVARLVELLSPLAKRKGLREGDGEGLLRELMKVAGVDQDALSRKISSVPGLGAAVVQEHLSQVLDPYGKEVAAALVKLVNDVVAPSVGEALQPAQNVIAELVEKQALPDPSKQVAEALGEILAGQVPVLDWVTIVRALEEHE